MVITKKSSSTKRFGPRYGKTLKEKFGRIETEHRKLHKCPYCNKIKVKRAAIGIWECKKCGAKFTGKAYSMAKPSVEKEAPQKEELSAQKGEE